MAMKKKIRPFNPFQSLKKKPGAAPGTIEHVGEQRVENVSITIHDYDEEYVDTISIESIEGCKPYLEKRTKTWIKVEGLHDIEKLKSIWSYFDLHPLIQEDIVNTSQRPKVEQYDNCMFIVMRMLQYAGGQKSIETEQISIILGANFVLSFQETDKPIFQPVVERLGIKKSRIRTLEADYLAYALMDNVTDHYFNLLDTIGEHLEQIEDELLDEPDEKTFHNIHAIRKEVVFSRKSIWPTREMLNTVIRDESEFIRESTKLYIRDVYDHMVQIIDNVENYRDMIMSMHDMYMSHVSNKMNEVMKVLTIIATIFIPLTFVAGIYGMNFDTEASPYNLPELSWYYGYPAFWGIMLVLSIIMVIYFKKKDWL
jgi:magnesium transporter